MDTRGVHACSPLPLYSLFCHSGSPCLALVLAGVAQVEGKRPRWNENWVADAAPLLLDATRGGGFGVAVWAFLLAALAMAVAAALRFL